MGTFCDKLLEEFCGVRRDDMDEMTKIRMEIQELYNKIEALKDVIKEFAPKCENQEEYTALKRKLEEI